MAAKCVAAKCHYGYQHATSIIFQTYLVLNTSDVETQYGELAIASRAMEKQQPMGLESAIYKS